MLLLLLLFCSFESLRCVSDLVAGKNPSPNNRFFSYLVPALFPFFSSFQPHLLLCIFEPLFLLTWTTNDPKTKR
ncbi:hypothetical protein BKA57DRAFT_455222 [Linnemannia elongata]|nr:hypothetical protein BKA57DRAFT_455222 [Linnemannia elongata]